MYFITSKSRMRGKYVASKFGFSLIAHYDNKLHRTGSGRSKLLKLLDRVGPFFGWTVRSLVYAGNLWSRVSESRKSLHYCGQCSLCWNLIIDCEQTRTIMRKTFDNRFFAYRLTTCPCACTCWPSLNEPSVRLDVLLLLQGSCCYWSW